MTYTMFLANSILLAFLVVYVVLTIERRIMPILDRILAAQETSNTEITRIADLIANGGELTAADEEVVASGSEAIAARLQTVGKPTTP